MSPKRLDDCIRKKETLKLDAMHAPWRLHSAGAG